MAQRESRVRSLIRIIPFSDRTDETSLAASEPTVSLETVRGLLLRFSLLLTTLIGWKAASDLWIQGDLTFHTGAVWLAIALHVVAFAALVFAARQSPGHKAAWLIALMVPLMVGAYWHIDAVQNRLNFGGAVGDAWFYSNYAAHLLRLGDNPYQHSMLDAFVTHRIAFRMQTPLLDGGTESHYPYGALAFLVHLPFLWLGITPLLAYPVFFILTLVVLYRAAPPLVRPLVLLPILLEPHYLSYSFGGVNDIIWTFFVLMTVIRWQRQRERAVWFGLACAVKQHPWFLAPFLLVRLWLEARDLPRNERVRLLVQFGAISAGVFVLINAPFILWDAQAWLQGITGPLQRPMILLAQGLSSLTLFDVVVIPKVVFLVLLLASLGVGLLLYWWHFENWREVIWVIPAVSLWFNYRSLNSYWFFFIIPFLFALLRQFAESLEFPPAPPAISAGTRRWSFALLAVVPALALGGIVWGASTPPDIRVGVQGAVYVRGDDAVRMQVQVSNTSKQVLTPRFSVQSGASQPLFWMIESGPETLPPGTSGVYTITTDIPGFSFSVNRGAQVIVTDAQNADLRAAALLPPDEGVRSYDGIPNGQFRYWDERTNAPLRWGLLNSASGAARLAASWDGAASPLELSLADAHLPNYSSVMLETWIPAPQVPVELWVKPPLNVNHAPGFDVVYGVELVSVGNDRRVWVLFGDTAGQGEIAPGLPYWMIAAPRDEWSLQSLDVRAIFEALDAELAPPQRVVRYDLPFPASMMRFRLLLAARRQPQRELTAQFGEVRSTAPLPDPSVLLDFDRAQPEWNLLWHGDVSYASRNYEQAREDYTSAVLASPTLPDAYMGLARANYALNNQSAALNAAELALANGYQPAIQAHNLIGAALAAGERYDDAYNSFREAEVYIAANTDVSSQDQIATYAGLAEYFVHTGDCAQAHFYFNRVLALSPDDTQSLGGLSRCRVDEG